MSQITVSELTFAYEGSPDNIFENVSFRIDTDWRLGFTGRNGRGKTTFLKLLLGKYEYRGKITSPISFEYFPFLPEDPTSPVLDMALGMNPVCEAWELKREFKKLYLPEELLYRPFASLSNGEQTKVLLAVLFLKENRFLLIDEPTNHLDAEARKLVCRYLNTKKGFILVSHDRMFLDNCVDHILSINKTNIEIQRGNFSSWYQNKERQDQFEQAENENLKREIRQLKAAARQNGEWADQVEASKIGKKSRTYEKCIDTRAYIGEKSRRMQQRRKNLERRQEKALEDKSRLLKNIEAAADLKLFPLSNGPDPLLVSKDLAISYTGSQICRPLSMEIHKGDRIALRGRNGCGKSSLLKLITGGPVTFDGTLQKGRGLILSYVPQDTSFLRGALSVYAARYGLDETRFKALLRKLDLSRSQFDRPMECFSEGQKKKVLLARSLCERAHLYMWDEPLNFIDVFSRMQIEDLILTYQPTLLFVEHDEAFSDKIATQTITMERNGLP